MKNTILTFSLSLTLGIGSVHDAGGAIITTADGSGADTYVDSNNPNGNEGGFDRMRVQSDAQVRKSIIRFDLSSISFPISGGDLTLTTRNSDPASSLLNPLSITLWGIDDGAAGDLAGNWTEAGLTWSNSLSPVGAENVQNDGLATTMGPDATILGSIDVSGGWSANNEMIFSSSSLNTFLQQDTNGLVTFAITYANSGEDTDIAFVTKETGGSFSGGAPSLNVVPEPSAALMFFTLISSLVVVRRRHHA